MPAMTGLGPTAADGARSRVRSPRLPYLFVAVSILLTALGAALAVANGDPLIGGFNADMIIVGTVYAAVGGLLATRVPDNRLGPIFLAAAWLFAMTFVLDEYTVYGAITAPGSLPAAGLAAWAGQWLWIPANSLLLCAVPLLFPDGHLPSPRWRPVAVLVSIGVAFEVATAAIALWPLVDDPAGATIADPSTVPGVIGWLASIGQITLFIIAPIVALSAVVIRYGRSRGAVRQQMRWFTAAVVVLVVTVIGDELAGQVVPGAQGLVSAVGFLLLPIALGMAVLRYRLWDLDRLVSRTVGWAIVTGLLLAVFAGAVVLLQAVLAPFTQENTLAVAASTLVAFALFQPLRRRVQRAVDRRFDRARYDGQRTVDAFAERLRNDVDLVSLRSSLAATADQAVRPSGTGLWLREGLR